MDAPKRIQRKRMFDPQEFAGLCGKELARYLTAVGYRGVSNRYRIVARVDRPDWKAINLNTHDHAMGADYYRRCQSSDWIENIPAYAYALIPNSRNDNTGFLEGELTNAD